MRNVFLAFVAVHAARDLSSGFDLQLFMFYFTAVRPLNHGNSPECRKHSLWDLSSGGRRVKHYCCIHNPACFYPVPSIDALGKLGVNNSFVPCQVGQRANPKRSWRLACTHLHPIKRSSLLLRSCCSPQQKFEK